MYLCVCTYDEEAERSKPLIYLYRYICTPHLCFAYAGAQEKA